MIVNDLRAHKTLDTETGIWLTRGRAQAREDLWEFEIHDGAKKMSFWTNRYAKNNEFDGIDITYILYDAATFYGKPCRRGYLSQIKKLLEGFSDYYGPMPQLEGKTRGFVCFEEKFLEALAKWEK